MKRRHRQSNRQGYVLVMSVFVLAIVGLLLTSIASHSLNLATEAAIAKRSLQDKWAIASCQKYGIENARRLLDDGEPLAVSASTIRLNGSQIDIVLADESAKLDVNVLYNNTNEAKTRSVVRDLSDSNELVPRIRPLDQDYRDARNDPFEAWGQVFRCHEYVEDFPYKLFEATQRLTCWSKRLNYRSASKEVLQESIKAIAGGATAQRLTRKLKENSDSPTSELIGSVADGRNREKLTRLLTNRSTSQSVWIRMRRGESVSSTLTVNEQLTGSINRIYSFSW